METIIARIFVHNWQRKLVALLTAVIIWLFVNHSINETKTISNIPVRIINVPPDETIQGLLPNGVLNRRITLSITGTKEVINELESSDLEVLLDASAKESDDWVVEVTKKNLVNLDPAVDLLKHVSQVVHGEFVIKLSKLITARIPLTIENPKGRPPQGYDYLDIWPQHLIQTVSGPEEEIKKLKEKGLTVSFDLSDISKSDLDAIKHLTHNDEISFLIPKKWKQVLIPFNGNTYEDFNDPEAQNLSIDFLRHELLPLDKEIPMNVFFPLEDIDQLNPENTSTALSNDIQRTHGVTVFTRPLFVKEVSRLFLDVVRNSIEIVIVSAPKSKREIMTWSVQFINPNHLEDTYAALSIANASSIKGSPALASKKKEELLRKRFRSYMQHFTLYLANAKKLHLKSTLDNNEIRIIAY